MSTLRGHRPPEVFGSWCAKEVAAKKSGPTSNEVSGPIIFSEVAGDPACRLEVPSDARRIGLAPSSPSCSRRQKEGTNKSTEVPGGHRKHQKPQDVPGGPRRTQEIPEEVPGGPRRPQEVPGGPRRSQEVPGDPRRQQEAPGVHNLRNCLQHCVIICTRI